ncbi:hypothetical protein [Micrococcus lylae]|nr:hypothetical protein [Micrococcus lylae]
MTTWESSTDMDTLSHGVATAAATLAETVRGQDTSWQELGDHYEGENEADLVNGFHVPVENAARVVLAAAAADSALVTFSGELRSLEDRRRTLEDDVASFNALHGAEDVEELPAGAAMWRQELLDTPGILQELYLAAAEDCARALTDITVDGLDVESMGSGRPGGWARDLLDTAGEQAIPKEPLSITTTTLGGLDVARLREPWLRHNDVIPETWQARFMGFNVGHYGASLVAGGAALRRAWTTRSWAPIRSMPLAMGMTLRNHSNEETKLAMKFNDRKTFQRPTWGALRTQFLDGLPIVGDARSLQELRKTRTSANSGTPEPAMKGAHRVESRTVMKFNTGVKGLGTVGTVVGAAQTYGSEHEKQLQENRAENPGASREEVEREARHDAGAQTVGNVGSTVLASAAAGAVAGSVVPGPGNVVGFAAGVVTGVAMSVPIADSDGDGQKDSAAEAVGDGAEWLWNKVRGK